MAIQKFKKVENWENLETFLDKKVHGFSIYWSKQLARTYCKCGKAYVGQIEKCECGNQITESFYFYSGNLQKFYSKYKIDVYGEENSELNIYLKHLKFNSLDSNKTLSIDIENNLICSIGKDYFKKTSFRSYYNRDEFDNFLHEEIIKHPYYDSFKFWYEKLIYKNPYTKNVNNSFNAIERIFNLEMDFPKIMKDDKIYQYPYFTAYIISRDSSYEDSFDDFVNLRFGKDAFEYLECLNYFLMYNDYGRNDINSFFRFKQYIFENKINCKKFRDSLNLINHYVLNHQLLINEAVELLDLVKSIYDKPERPNKFPYYYKYFDHYYRKKTDPLFKDFFKVEYLEFFDTYLKENISICEEKENLIWDFIERIVDMIEAGIPIKRDNFKIKNYNWLYTSEKMAETYKLPEGKVSLFLDWFETNPLEALELVSNRRKLTNKQLDDLIDKLSK